MQHKPSYSTLHVISRIPASMAVCVALILFHATTPQIANAQAAAAASAARADIVRISMGSSLTLSDNINLSATNKESGAILSVTPSLSWQHTSARYITNTTVGFTGSITNNSRSSNQATLSLDSNTTINLLDRHLLIDLRSRIAEQDRSLFGLTPTDRPDTTDSRVQTRYFSAGATYQNRYLSGWNHQVGYQVDTSSTSNSTTADTHTQSLNASLGYAPLGNDLSGTLSMNAQRYYPKDLTDYTIRTTKLQLSWRPDIEYSFFVSAGRQYDGYKLTDKDNPIYDIGATWTPGPRTKFDVSVGDRYYGTTQSLTFTHRTRMTTWDISHSKSISNTRQRSEQVNAYTVKKAGVTLGTLYDPSDILTDQFSLYENTQIKLAISGKTNSLSLSVYHVKNKLLTNLLSTSATFGNNSIENNNDTIQNGASIDWRVRLDKLNSLGTSFGHQKTTASQNGTSSKADTLSVNYSRTLSPKTSTGVTVRHYRRKDNNAQSVKENSVVGTINTTF